MDSQRFQNAIALRDSGRLEEATRQLRMLADSTPEASEKGGILLNEADCLAALGRMREARERLAEAIKLLPEGEECQLHIGYCEAFLDNVERNYAQSVRRLERLLRKHAALLSMPEHRDLYEQIQIRRGMMLVELGKPRKARPILEEVLASDAEKDADFYYQLGACYFKLGRKELASKYLAEALNCGLDKYWQVQAHYRLGIIYYIQGAYAHAKQEFEICAAHVAESDVPRSYIYKGLAKVCKGLGLKDDAERYKKLAKVS